MTHTFRTPDGTPISRFCFGAMQFGGKADEAQSRAMYDAARAAGINFFDTAYAYTGGASETFLGRFAAPERDRLYIASKADFSRGSGAAVIRASVEESRRRLGMDRIDLYYLHRWDGATPLEETFGALAEEQAAGRIGDIGVSNFSAWQVMKAERVARGVGLRVAMIQPMYNLVKRQVEVEILPMALSEGFGVASYSPLGGGLLSGKYATGERGRVTDDPAYAVRYSPAFMHDAALGLGEIAAIHGVHPATLAVAWAARHPGITAPIVSARTAEQLAPSLAALDYKMDDAMYARLTALSPTPAPATDRLEEA
jgi:aryl-alcohol dehydrogenase-like predicted oxidoreductase